MFTVRRNSSLAPEYLSPPRRATWQIGLDFRLANGSSFFDPSYLTYAFALKTIYYQDKLPRSTVKLNYSRCAFTSAEGGPVVATAMCPDESIVVLQVSYRAFRFEETAASLKTVANLSRSPSTRATGLGDLNLFR